MFRQLQTTLIAETEIFLDGKKEAVGFARRLYRLTGTQLTALHGHREIEDHHYLPLLKGLDRRLESGFEILDSDPHVLAHCIEQLAGGANAVLAAVMETQTAL